MNASMIDRLFHILADLIEIGRMDDAMKYVELVKNLNS